MGLGSLESFNANKKRLSSFDDSLFKLKKKSGYSSNSPLKISLLATGVDPLKLGVNEYNTT